MISNSNESGMICQCSTCREAYDIKELIISKRKLYNIEIEEKICPYCGGNARTLLKDVKWLNHRFIEQEKIYAED